MRTKIENFKNFGSELSWSSRVYLLVPHISTTTDADAARLDGLRVFSYAMILLFSKPQNYNIYLEVQDVNYIPKPLKIIKTL